MRLVAILTATILAAMLEPDARAETWMGLSVAPELTPSDTCSKYGEVKANYNYDRDKLLEHVRRTTDGDLYSPYTARTFSEECDVHVEHIVARKEAHYSGLCLEKNAHRRKEFASDLVKLTLAGRGLNQAKRDCDAATWIPLLNRCWFATRVLQVRKRYELTIDKSERDALDAILSDCKPEHLSMGRTLEPAVAPLVKWDADWNGQINCDELRRKGVETPIGPDHEAYPFVSDADCDGKMC